MLTPPHRPPALASRSQPLSTIIFDPYIFLPKEVADQLRAQTEATLFALGIRADTGALSYAQTTPRDGEALVWLMRHGSSQSAIAEFGHARLSAVQRDILGEALHKTARLRHEGLSIGTVQLYTGRGFVTGMAAVAARCRPRPRTTV